jgi:hypothetical protein
VRSEEFDKRPNTVVIVKSLEADAKETLAEMGFWAKPSWTHVEIPCPPSRERELRKLLGAFRVQGTRQRLSPR